MSDLIDRDEVIEIIESVCSADDTYWEPGTLEKIRNLPTHPTPSNTLGALDCVSREELTKEIETYFGDLPIAVHYDMLALAQRLLPVQPDKDLIHLQKEQAYMQGYADGQKPRKGKWIYGESEIGNDGYYCSVCGNFVPWKYDEYDIDFIKEFLFCPKCGADMRGDSDEKD